jgi:arabinose-5-phosphate isomerase
MQTQQSAIQHGQKAGVGQQALEIQQALTQVLRKEADAILSIVDKFPENAWQLVDLILATRGKIVFSGLGKSGLVAQKLAATSSSLGIASFFLHPSDALHGDLGSVQKGDLFIALSKSATGDEFDHILPILGSFGVSTCLICCSQGRLVEKADLVIALPLEREACPLNLAPTSSSTIMMAFGDAIAVAVSNLKGFSKQEFARYHPAGALGKRLLLTVRSLMHKSEALPLVQPTTSFKDLLLAITSKKLGIGVVIDQNNALQGIITDGDLRRACEQGPDVFSMVARDIATLHPKFVTADTLAFVALEVMEKFNITSLVVVEHEHVVGLIHIHDLIKAGIQG